MKIQKYVVLMALLPKKAQEPSTLGIVEGSVEKISLEEITNAMKKIKLVKVSALSEVSIEMINANGKVGIDVMMKLCQRKGWKRNARMLEDWKTSFIMPIYKGKGDMMNCDAYRRVKLLEYGVKTVERVLKKRIKALMVVDNMQFGFMPG